MCRAGTPPGPRAELRALCFLGKETELWAQRAVGAGSGTAVRERWGWISSLCSEEMAQNWWHSPHRWRGRLLVHGGPGCVSPRHVLGVRHVQPAASTDASLSEKERTCGPCLAPQLSRA